MRSTLPGPSLSKDLSIYQWEKFDELEISVIELLVVEHTAPNKIHLISTGNEKPDVSREELDEKIGRKPL